LEIGFYSCIRCGGREVYSSTESTGGYAFTIDTPGPVDPTFINTFSSAVTRCRQCGEKARWVETAYGRQLRLEERQKFIEDSRRLALVLFFIGMFALAVVVNVLIYLGQVETRFIPLAFWIGVYGVALPILSLWKSVEKRVESFQAVSLYSRTLNALALFTLIFLLQVTLLVPTSLEVALSAIGCVLVPLGWASLLFYQNRQLSIRRQQEIDRDRRLEYEELLQRAGDSVLELQFLQEDESFAEVRELPPSEPFEAKKVSINDAIAAVPLSVHGSLPGLGLILLSFSLNLINFMNIQGIWHSVIYWIGLIFAFALQIPGFLVLLGIRYRFPKTVQQSIDN